MEQDANSVNSSNSSNDYVLVASDRQILQTKGDLKKFFFFF